MATPVEVTQRPIPRPMVMGAGLVPLYAGPVRPLIRPQSAQEIALATGPALNRVLAGAARPITRPAILPQLAMAKKQAKRRGAVCGSPDIQGDEVGSVPGRLAVCGIHKAVRVRSVADVRLSTPALMNCDTARALQVWTQSSVIPTFRKRGPVVEMTVVGHYDCRTRNHKPGARISEHGKGKAIDIAGFVMADGEEITLLQGWRRKDTRALLEQVHRGACGPFGTVLGPRADRFHQDHFHFDTARYGTGPYCR